VIDVVPWPVLRDEVLGADILVIASRPGSGSYWNMGPGPGPSYTETDHRHDWSAKTGRTMASNLVAVATALQRSPVPPPPD
jgi:hypothetical protein